jgi:phage FluMu protein Com
MGFDSRKMKVISEEEASTRSVLAPSFQGTAIKGEGTLSYRCGSCDLTLLKDLHFKQVQHMVIKCGRCAAFNEIPLAHHTN